MLGKDYYKIELHTSLNDDLRKSLTTFYLPLIKADAFSLYEHFIYSNENSFYPLTSLLTATCFSLSTFEDALDKLNEYRLVKTLKNKNEDRYIFVVNNPLSMYEFTKDDIFVRDFIKKTSGEYYQNIISAIRTFSNNIDYEDISKKISADILTDWSKEDESYLHAKNTNFEFSFNTFFDINKFLKDISTTLLPLNFRTEENMKELALLADLYNISYDKMRTFLPRVCSSNKNQFDLNLLNFLCEKSHSEFRKIEDGAYNVPCELFLMNKQGGKDLTSYDKRLIYVLSHNYHLTPAVINVVLESSLNKYDNKLIEKYVYPTASDLYRLNITSADKALERLSKYTKNKTKKATSTNIVPDYSTNNNQPFDKKAYDELMARRDKNE